MIYGKARSAAQSLCFQVVLTRQQPLRDAKRRECMPDRARNEGGRRLRYPPSYCHGQTADCDSLSLFDMPVLSRKRLLRSTCLSSGLRVKVESGSVLNVGKPVALRWVAPTLGDHDSLGKR